MGKTHTTISIDEDLRRQARQLGINLSEIMEESLRVCFAEKEGNVENINIEIEKNKQKKLEKQLVFLQKQLKNSQNLVENYQNIVGKKKEEELIRQKEEAEKMITCQNCNILKKAEFMFDFKIGKICKACYMVATGEEVKRWQNG